MGNSLLGMVFNYSPVLHFSGDDRFGSYPVEDQWRISFLYVPLGILKVYFITFSKVDGGFKLYKILRFKDVCPVESDASIMAKQNSFLGLIEHQKDAEIDNQIKFLDHLISNCSERVSILYGKANIFTAIFVVFIGFVFVLLSEVFNRSESRLEVVFLLLAFFLTVSFFNYGSFIFYTLSIKGYHQSRFSDFKGNPTKQRLAGSIYYDWISKSNESNILASIVRNIQHYAVMCVVFSFALWGAGLIIERVNTNDISYNSNEVFKVFMIDGRIDSGELLNAIDGIENSTDDFYIIGSSGNEKLPVVRKFLKSLRPDIDVELIMLDEDVGSGLIYVKRK